MKRLLLFTLLALMLGGLSGCRVAECWRYAWNSRFHPERNVIVTEPVMMVDPCCDPCADPCGTSCGAPATMCAPMLPR
ncbi:MAG: hypothetical protein GX594_07410 [Pirellulaceae bacterium]|nr:hypothetical protein [Pirellulaceae bacterium]